MASKFVQYSPYSGVGVSEVALRDLFFELLENGAIFVHEKGFIAGVLRPLFFAPEVLIADEIAWWAEDDGTSLRLMFEEWAAAMGCKASHMSTLNNAYAARIAQHLTDNGYTPTEVHYLKVIA